MGGLSPAAGNPHGSPRSVVPRAADDHRATPPPPTPELAAHVGADPGSQVSISVPAALAHADVYRMSFIFFTMT